MPDWDKNRAKSPDDPASEAGERNEPMTRAEAEQRIDALQKKNRQGALTQHEGYRRTMADDLKDRRRKQQPHPPMPDTDPLQREIGSAGRAPLQGSEPGQVGPDWIEQPGPQPDAVNQGDMPADRLGRVLNPDPGGGLPGQGSGGVPGRLRGDEKSTPQAPKTIPEGAAAGVTPAPRPKNEGGT